MKSLAWFLAIALCATVSPAATTLDGGAGSLRDTIATSADGDTITFAPDLSGQTISLTNDSPLTICWFHHIPSSRRLAPTAGRLPLSIHSLPLRQLTPVQQHR